VFNFTCGGVLSNDQIAQVQQKCQELINDKQDISDDALRDQICQNVSEITGKPAAIISKEINELLSELDKATNGGSPASRDMAGIFDIDPSLKKLITLIKLAKTLWLRLLV
tara:strand:- start:298 stop:630 length:333 start_codon:yes stop_codon:yes gene_type:complete